ncbi:MAG: transposase [Chloracidobacterium sp.]|nr:transposase [Chloracidobacterium sp.]MCO5333511.1 transposase [Pyrinomonadaceae bacterium]
MRKKYTEEQIVGILRGAEASGKGVKEYCREKGVHETTYYAWRKRYGMTAAAP